MDGIGRPHVRALSAMRLGIGVAALVAPGSFARLMLGARADGRVRFLVRLFASREIGVAAVTLAALERRHVPARVLEMNALVDAVDGVAGLLAARHLPWRTRVSTVVGASGAVAVVLAYRSRLP